MDGRVKQRIVGVIVLVALAVIFIPLLFTGRGRVPKGPQLSSQIPLAPEAPRATLTLPDHVMPSRVPSTQSAPKSKPVKKPTTTAKKVTKKSKPLRHVKTKQPKHKHAKLPLPTHAESWAVQVASFTSRQNAKHLVKQLRAKGYPAYVNHYKNKKGKRITRVLIGPELNRARANKHVIALKKAFKLNGLIVPYKPA